MSLIKIEDLEIKEELNTYEMDAVFGGKKKKKKKKDKDNDDNSEISMLDSIGLWF